MAGQHEGNGEPRIDEFDLADVPDATAEVIPHASLLVASGADAGKTFSLAGREILIGRSPSSQVRIDEPGVSAKHARLVLVNGQHVLVDLESTNGTFLNGRKLDAREAIPLAVGDSIQIAETVLAYVGGAGDRVEPTRQLSKLAPAIPGEASLMRMPEAQLLAQLLSGTASAAPAPAPPTLEERIAKLGQLAAVLKRHWLVFFAAMALCALAFDATVFLNPPATEASFKLRISPPKGKQEFGGHSSDFDLNLFYASSEQNFVGPSVVTETLRAMNGGEPPSQASVNGALGGLKFEAVGEALYKGSYSHREPAHAVKFLHTHLEKFIASEIKRSVHVVQAEVDFLTARLKETDAELSRTERELQAFKSQHLEGLPENASGHMSSRESLLTRRAELGAQVEKTRLELELAKKQLAEEAPLAIKRGEGSEQHERSLADVRRQLSELRSKGLGEAHPQVEALKRQAADLERMIAEARAKSASSFDRSANPGLVALRNRVGELEVAHRSAKAELGTIGGLVSRLEGIVGKMPEVEARYAELTRSYEATKDLHAKLFDKLRSNQLQLELERASALARYEVVAPPQAGSMPLPSALKKRTALGLALGLVLASAIVALIELRGYLKRQRSNRLAIVSVRPGPP